MRLLDLFCSAGGAAEGYRRAGFDEIVGVDIKSQPYPFMFVHGDALEYVAAHGREFDAIHASPPCQKYIRSGNVNHGEYWDSVPVTRDAIVATGIPFVIENVPGAPLIRPIILCGSMFNLEVRRHRGFEAPSIFSLQPPCDHSRKIAGVYGNAHGKGGAWKPGKMLPGDLETWSRAMGIDWMTTAELAQAIPPAYTEYIGRQLLAVILEAAAK